MADDDRWPMADYVFAYPFSRKVIENNTVAGSIHAVRLQLTVESIINRAYAAARNVSSN
jgi:hypothetical protein